MYEYQAQLVHVHDGDSLRVDVDLGFSIWHQNLDVRLNGIDCPELGRPDQLGEQARTFTFTWFTQHAGPYVLNTVKDKAEKFGRMLADIRAADQAVLVHDLLAAGLAKPYSGHGPRPW